MYTAAFLAKKGYLYFEAGLPGRSWSLQPDSMRSFTEAMKSHEHEYFVFFSVLNKGRCERLAKRVGSATRMWRKGFTKPRFHQLMSHRLASLPALVIELIFASIHPSECLKFRRLCHATNAILTSRHFARLSLQRHLPATPPPRVCRDPTPLDRLWFHWPHHFQDLYASLWLRECIEIRWRNCNLSGVIPSSIGHLRNLTYLSLASNHLHGTLPDTLTSLTNLTHLYLSGNALTGRLPGGLFNALPYLSHASLRANRLSGALPESTRPALRELYLDCNAFEGIAAPDLPCTLKGLRGEYLRRNTFARGEVCALRWRLVECGEDLGIAPCN